MEMHEHELLLNKMDSYIDSKLYNSEYGDMVPLICANALNADVVIAHRGDIGFNVMAVTPDTAEKLNPPFLVMKCGDHYNGLTPIDKIIPAQNVSEEEQTAPAQECKRNCQVSEKQSHLLENSYHHVMKDFTCRNPINLITAHLNINSIRNKFRIGAILPVISRLKISYRNNLNRSRTSKLCSKYCSLSVWDYL